MLKSLKSDDTGFRFGAGSGGSLVSSSTKNLHQPILIKTEGAQDSAMFSHTFNRLCIEVFAHASAEDLREQDY